MTEEIRLIRAARIDKDGVYLGMEDVPEGELTAEHLPQITECDLPPGKYRWRAEAGAFVPIDSGFRQIEPDALAAIHAGLEAVRKSGVKLPKVTTEWLEHFKTTWDGQK